MSNKHFDKERFAQRLLQLMTDNNETIYSLAEYLHLSPSAISRYTSGGMNPKTLTIEAISSKFGVNPIWLMGANVDKYISDSASAIKRLPIMGTIAAGQPILAQENIEGYECVAADSNADFCLRVKGDSMINARILDGDIVYIRQQPDVENGEIAAVLVDDLEATLKRVYKINGSIILRAENPNYPDMVFSKKEMKQINILGKAVSFKSEVR